MRGTGAWGEALRRIRVAGLDLVIGAIPRVPRPTTAALTRYDRVVRALIETHASVLPARFGTTAPSLDALGAAVGDRRDALRRSLRLVRHRVQMTVRVFGLGDGLAVGLAVGLGDGLRAGGGRQFLQRRAKELQVPGSEPLRAAVKRWVRAERTERHKAGRLVGTIYHLVPLTAARPYRAAIQRAASAASLTVVVSGPWPPYAFAEAAW
jgi:Gas vesicle synthesis protein GvpL/GvpF